MNVYDFDGTIYDGDSGIDFIKFAFGKKPFRVSWQIVKSIPLFILYKMKKVPFKIMKESLFAFVKYFDDLSVITTEFAEKRKNKIKKYYAKTRREDDVIVSASLDFYLLPLCQEIGLKQVICTKYDVKNGKIVGENCKKEEKVKRLEQEYGKDCVVENAYGDSQSDYPILKRAQNGYLVVGEDLVDFVDNS